MAINYTTAVKNARLDAVTTAIGASGTLEIGTTGMATILATFNLNNPAAGAAASGVLTLSGFPKTASAGNGGTAAEARIRAGGSTDIVTGLTVGTAASDIILDSVSITGGQDVTLNSATITHS